MSAEECPCPNCGVPNRVRPYLLSEAPRCGRCGIPLPEGRVIMTVRQAIQYYKILKQNYVIV